MCQPQILLNTEVSTGAIGLGLFLIRSATDRTWVGHTGARPGVFSHRESGTGGIALMNATFTQVGSEWMSA